MRKFVEEIGRGSDDTDNNDEKDDDKKDDDKKDDDKKDDDNNNEEETNGHQVDVDVTDWREEHDIFEAEIYYKNGDEEVITCYGEYDRNDKTIEIIVEKCLRYQNSGWVNEDVTRTDISTRTIHPTYLSRDVVYNKIDTEIWEGEIHKRETKDHRGYIQIESKIENVDCYRSVDKY